MTPQIHPSDFEAWLASTTDARTVIDVREGWELQTASIKPAGFAVVHIPMNDTPQRMAELQPDTPIAVLCHHGARSQQVANYLVQNGFTNVSNIAGGIALWSQARDASVPQY